MQYLVTGEYVEPEPLLPPDQVAARIRQAILPSHDALTNLKAEGKLIAGGYAMEGNIVSEFSGFRPKLGRTRGDKLKGSMIAKRLMWVTQARSTEFERLPSDSWKI